jgi:hypothetical protein
VRTAKKLRFRKQLTPERNELTKRRKRCHKR